MWLRSGGTWRMRRWQARGALVTGREPCGSWLRRAPPVRSPRSASRRRAGGTARCRFGEAGGGRRRIVMVTPRTATKPPTGVTWPRKPGIRSRCSAMLPPRLGTRSQLSGMWAEVAAMRRQAADQREAAAAERKATAILLEGVRQDRLAAAADRAETLQDREAAVSDRKAAAKDRDAAAADRQQAAIEQAQKPMPDTLY